MSQVNMHEAKSQLSALISRVLNGEKIVIARNNKAVVQIVPFKKEERVPGKMKGKIVLSQDWQEADQEVLELFDQSLDAKI
ncbi:MAG: type II toxin-antitoxin system Phd/YefM family antitoxin [Leadbetterella sp.]